MARRSSPSGQHRMLNALNHIQASEGWEGAEYQYARQPSALFVACLVVLRL